MTRRVTAARLSQMPVAPNEACVRCMKGDTTTAVGVRGEAEWLIAVTMRVTGDDMETAHRTLAFAYPDVPEGVVETALTLCAECAEELDVPIGRIPGPIPALVPRP